MELNDMLKFVAETDNVEVENVKWYSWPQVFGSTSGPKGGAGGCAMTTFQVYAFDTGVRQYKYCSGVWRKWTGEFMCRW